MASCIDADARESAYRKYAELRASPVGYRFRARHGMIPELHRSSWRQWIFTEVNTCYAEMERTNTQLNWS
jgi:hypothetical protein